MIKLSQVNDFDYYIFLIRKINLLVYLLKVVKG